VTHWPRKRPRAGSTQTEGIRGGLVTQVISVVAVAVSVDSVAQRTCSGRRTGNLLIHPTEPSARGAADVRPWYGLAASVHDVCMETSAYFLAVRAVVNRENPVGLIHLGAPEDEYGPEVADLIKWRKAVTAEEVSAVFLRWFGGRGAMTSGMAARIADSINLSDNRTGPRPGCRPDRRQAELGDPGPERSSARQPGAPLSLNPPHDSCSVRRGSAERSRDEK